MAIPLQQDLSSHINNNKVVIQITDTHLMMMHLFGLILNTIFMQSLKI